MGIKSLLVGDIGGTNARFATASTRKPGFSNAKSFECAQFESAEDAIREYLTQIDAPSPDVICLAVAGPIVEESARFTNNSWNVSAGALRKIFSTDHVQLLNDFEAIAYSIPLLEAKDCHSLGLPDAQLRKEDDYTIAVLGPGTGLGAVGLCHRDGRLYPIVGEAGHVGFAAETRLQVDIMMALRERYDRVSDERLLSGPGVESIYWALTRIHGENRVRPSASKIFQEASGNGDPRAVEAVQCFFEMLGQAAGNLALTLGAWDGIFIGGGIVRRYPKLLENSPFRSGFENKGRHRSIMERIPTYLIAHDEPGLLGASYVASGMA